MTIMIIMTTDLAVASWETKKYQTKQNISVTDFIAPAALTVYK